MVQRIVPFLHTPLEATEFLDLFRSTFKSGVVRACEVTAGGSGWTITVRAGEVIIDGSWVYDDLDKIGGIDLGHSAGTDRHYVVYQTYSYAASDPPATSVFAVTAGTTPPTQPTIPANSVKLCDIYVPTAAASIGTVPGGNQQDPVQVSSTGVRFVQAPRLWSRSDTGELMDRLIMSVGNTLMFTQGGITYDDTLSRLYLPQPIVVQALCSTYRESFNNAPAIVRATISAVPAGLVVPGTIGSRDVIVYTTIDRSSPTTTGVATIRFLDRNSPADPELSELLNYNTRTQIVILGVISGARLFMPGVNGQLPAPDADDRMFLKNTSTGVHVWSLLNDIYLFGGLHSGLADAAARNAISADLRKQGLVAYVQDEDTFYTLAGGVTNSDWTPVNDDSRLHGGWRVLDWTFVNPTLMTAAAAAAAAIPAAKRKVGMLVLARESVSGYREELEWDGANFVAHISRGDWGVVTGCEVTNPSAATVRVAPGQFRCLDGTLVTVYENTDVAVTLANGIVAWDRSAAAFVELAKGAVLFEDFVFAYGAFAGGNLTKFVPCAPRAAQAVSGVVLVGSDSAQGGTHFDTHYHALVWRTAHVDAAFGYKTFHMPGDASYQVDDLVTLPGTASGVAGAGATITGVGTRFLRDFAVGDWIRLSTNRSARVTAVASDTSLTVATLTNDVVAVAVSRPNWVGPHAHLADVSVAEIGAVDNVVFTGQRGQSTVIWGAVTATEEIEESKAFVTGGTGSDGWHLSDFIVDYTGSQDATDHDICPIHTPGKAWLVSGIEFDGGDRATHLVRFGVDFGSSFDDSPGFCMRNCQVHDFSEATALFYTSAAVEGDLLMESVVGFDLAISAICEFAATSTINVKGVDSMFDVISVALMLYDVAGDWSTHNNFSRCEFTMFAPGFRCVARRTSADSSDARRVSLTDCVIHCSATIELTGLNVQQGLRVTGPGCNDNQSSQHVAGNTGLLPEAFATRDGIKFKGSSENHNFAMTRGVAKSALLPGKADASGFVPHTVELHPILTGADESVRVPNPGTVQVGFPDGRVVTWAPGGNTDLNIDTTDNLHTPFLTAQSHTVYYFFLRKDPATNAINGLAFSDSPPASTGALNAADDPDHNGGSYTATDYVFIGSLVTGDVSSGDPWGACRVAHLGNGLRRVFVSVPGSASIPGFQQADADSGGTMSGVLSHATLNDDIATAREFEFECVALLRGSAPTTSAFGLIQVESPNDDGVLVRARTGVLISGAGAGDFAEARNTVSVPRQVRATNYQSGWSATAGSGGDLSGRVQTYLRSWLENVNAPIPTVPPDNGT